MKKDVIVVGAGIFGCSAALELKKRGYNVRIVEKGKEILGGATKFNHNRIHYGYHYPRSIETARQSLLSLSSFLIEYGKSVKANFYNYYAIAEENSMVSANKYEIFCSEMGISYAPVDLNSEIINNKLLSANYLVNEPIYDCDILQSLVEKKLNDEGIRVDLNTDIRDINVTGETIIINCSYSALNDVNTHFGAGEIKGKYQDVLIPVIKWEHEPIGLTVMDGPFCSIMPRGFNKNEFLVYHVVEGVFETDCSSFKLNENEFKKISERILEKSSIYYPFLKDVEVIDYWKSKRFVPDNSTTDSRTSQIFISPHLKNYISVFSGKVSTAVSIAKVIANYLDSGEIKEMYV
jgi:hypothetical protein